MAPSTTDPTKTTVPEELKLPTDALPELLKVAEVIAPLTEIVAALMLAAVTDGERRDALVMSPAVNAPDKRRLLAVAIPALSAPVVKLLLVTACNVLSPEAVMMPAVRLTVDRAPLVTVPELRNPEEVTMSAVM